MSSSTDIQPKTFLEKIVFMDHFAKKYSPEAFLEFKTKHPEITASVSISYKEDLEEKKELIKKMKKEFEMVNQFFLHKHSKNPLKRLMRRFYFKKRMLVDYETEFLDYWSFELRLSPFVISFLLTNS